MQPVSITPEIAELYPNTKIYSIGPPPEIAEEDCGTVEALVGKVEGGAFDGATNYRVYWRPNEEDLERLNKGLEIEIQFIHDGLVPHTVGVI